MTERYPSLYDMTGNVSINDQLRSAGIDPASVPPFEAGVLNFLQALLTATLELQERIGK